MSRFLVSSDFLPVADFKITNPSSLQKPMLSKFMFLLIVVSMHSPMS